MMMLIYILWAADGGVCGGGQWQGGDGDGPFCQYLWMVVFEGYCRVAEEEKARLVDQLKPTGWIAMDIINSKSIRKEIRTVESM